MEIVLDVSDEMMQRLLSHSKEELIQQLLTTTHLLNGVIAEMEAEEAQKPAFVEPVKSAYETLYDEQFAAVTKAAWMMAIFLEEQNPDFDSYPWTTLSKPVLETIKYITNCRRILTSARNRPETKVESTVNLADNEMCENLFGLDKNKQCEDFFGPNDA